jgi:hypothetical protein
MLRAVYVRTLNPGVSDDEFVAAWMPPHRSRDSYPAAVTTSRSVTDDRQIMSIVALDLAPEAFPTVLADLVHPRSQQRLDAIVESTQLEAVYVDTQHFGRATPLG